jgi:hypothetical protein
MTKLCSVSDKYFPKIGSFDVFEDTLEASLYMRLFTYIDQT